MDPTGSPPIPARGSLPPTPPRNDAETGDSWAFPAFERRATGLPSPPREPPVPGLSEEPPAARMREDAATQSRSPLADFLGVRSLRATEAMANALQETNRIHNALNAIVAVLDLAGRSETANRRGSDNGPESDSGDERETSRRRRATETRVHALVRRPAPEGAHLMDILAPSAGFLDPFEWARDLGIGMPAPPPPPAFPARAPLRYPSGRPHMPASFLEKLVCVLHCTSCSSLVCTRGMRAILLANALVELYSTDTSPRGVELVAADYTTRNCTCRIRDVACLGCGNVVGYHVVQPCAACLGAANNGHFWMFHVDAVRSSPRMNQLTHAVLAWKDLAPAELDLKPGAFLLADCADR